MRGALARVRQAFRLWRAAWPAADSLSALCNDLLAECTRLSRENQELRRLVLENAVFASRYRDGCAVLGIEPVHGESIQ